MTQDEIDKLATAISSSIAICHKKVLTLEEAATYTGLSKSCLYKLTSAKTIPHFKPNGKVVFFNREALEKWMMTNPVATAADLTATAQAYCMRNKTI